VIITLRNIAAEYFLKSSIHLLILWVKFMEKLFKPLNSSSTKALIPMYHPAAVRNLNFYN
jgi:uracil-DNA glycosylase